MCIRDRAKLKHYGAIVTKAREIQRKRAAEVDNDDGLVDEAVYLRSTE